MSPSTRDRLTNLSFAGIAAILIGVSAWLHPAVAGHGTHEQLGLPPCRFFQLTHIPCFSCGMTTSWAWMAHGHPVESFLAQPMGAVLFLAAALAGTASLYFLFAGGTVERRLAGRGRILTVAFMTGMLAAWAFKIVETVSK